MDNTALLVVDMQNALVKAHPYRESDLLNDIAKLIAAARESKTEVIFVRHDGSSRGMLQPGTPQWEIHSAVAPEAGEKIFDKRYCSAFQETGLDAYLTGREIKTVILLGMQTEYCIDASCKSAFEHGYRVIIPEGGTSTFDTPFLAGKELTEFYEKMIWAPCFAELMPVELLLAKLA